MRPLSRQLTVNVFTNLLNEVGLATADAATRFYNYGGTTHRRWRDRSHRRGYMEGPRSARTAAIRETAPTWWPYQRLAPTTCFGTSEALQATSDKESVMSTSSERHVRGPTREAAIEAAAVAQTTVAPTA